MVAAGKHGQAARPLAGVWAVRGGRGSQRPAGSSGGAGAQARWGGRGPLVVTGAEQGGGVALSSLNYLSENAFLVWP